MTAAGERKRYTEPITPGSPPPGHADAERGIECPLCGCHHFRVVYTRRQAGRILRRRECRHCGRRLSTVERPKAEIDER